MQLHKKIFSLTIATLVFCSSSFADGALRQKIRASLTYGALGDALGAGLEMKSSESIKDLPLNQFYMRDLPAKPGDFDAGTGYRPGWVTDDTWMSIGVMRSVEKYFNKETLKFEMDRFGSKETVQIYWDIYNQETQLITKLGHLQPNQSRGIWWGGIEDFFKGQRTLEKIYDSMKKKPKDGRDQPGNGTVMRAHVLGFIPDLNTAAEIARNEAESTHPHETAKEGSAVVATLLHQMAYDQDFDLRQIIKHAIAATRQKEFQEYLAKVDALPGFESSESEQFPAGALNTISEAHLNETNIYLWRDDRSKGTGLHGGTTHTVGAVLYVLKHYDPKSQPLSLALRRLIRMGGDVDSAGMIGMALLGARYAGTAMDDIPALLSGDLKDLKPLDEIEKAANDYHDFIEKYLQSRSAH